MLISISDPLPFLAAAGVVAVCMAAFAATGVRYRRRESSSGEADIVEVAFRIVDLIRCQAICRPSSWPTPCGSSRSPP